MGKRIIKIKTLDVYLNRSAHRKISTINNLLLCWKTRTVAPEPRAPFTIELWFRESLIINPPCLDKKLNKNNCHINLTQGTCKSLCCYLSNQDWKNGRVCQIAHAKHYGCWLLNKVCNTLLQFSVQRCSS